MAEIQKGEWREIDSLPIDDGTRKLVDGKPRDDGIYKSLQVLVGEENQKFQVVVNDSKHGINYVARVRETDDMQDVLLHPFAYGAEKLVEKVAVLVPEMEPVYSD